ncbi:XRE family transcriptional regulator [Muribaculum sp.]|uniref:LexA family transcriptional regulator n=1 Tax=Muribaculum sp. TaxID=1918611 RepID=UPI0023C47CF7|nr:XRE family transcriptional regulator [Muribaculum sp.]MDE5706038.1 XRE family transcriptional regulator [Muribaculum sp.]
MSSEFRKQISLDKEKATAVVGRVRHLMGLTRLSQAQFAKKIGLDPANISKYINGHLPITDNLINRIVVNTGVSREWLRDGIGLPFDKNHVATPAVARVEPGFQMFQQRSLPIYDIAVLAGVEELDRAFTQENVIGYLTMPHLSPNWAVVQAQGNSMMPIIESGAYLAFLPENEFPMIAWGEIYIVVMENRRVVKYVRRHDNPEKIILKSANEDYDPMEVNKSDIVAMYPVKAIINMHLCH